MRKLIFCLFMFFSAQAHAEDMPGMEDLQKNFHCPGVDQLHLELKYSSSPGYYIPGLKLIIMDWKHLLQYSDVVRRFIFTHECVHAIEHQNNSELMHDEDYADCGAAKIGVAEGWLNKTAIIQVCAGLSKYPADETHKPFIQRCNNIRKCSGLE